MRLAAMVMVGPGEGDRYLASCIESLLGFCDEVSLRVEIPVPDLADLFSDERVRVSVASPTFFHHEGRARQELLDWTMKGNPTHIVVVDADEFVVNGQHLRQEMSAGTDTGVWRLEMTEIWGADEHGLKVRWDGAWKPRPCGIAYAVPPDMLSNRQTIRHYRMPNSAGACGRVPMSVAMASNRTLGPATVPILHFGWACKADRPARYARYADTGGFGHKNSHIASIMWGDERVQIERMPWPDGLDKETLLARVNRG